MFDHSVSESAKKKHSPNTDITIQYPPVPAHIYKLQQDLKEGEADLEAVTAQIDAAFEGDGDQPSASLASHLSDEFLQQSTLESKIRRIKDAIIDRAAYAKESSLVHTLLQCKPKCLEMGYICSDCRRIKLEYYTAFCEARKAASASIYGVTQSLLNYPEELRVKIMASLLWYLIDDPKVILQAPPGFDLTIAADIERMVGHLPIAQPGPVQTLTPDIQFAANDILPALYVRTPDCKSPAKDTLPTFLMQNRDSRAYIEVCWVEDEHRDAAISSTGERVEGGIGIIKALLKLRVPTGGYIRPPWL